MDIRSFREKLEKQFPDASKKIKNDLGLQIGNEIERNRISHKLTQTELANLIGTKQSGISRLEKGTLLPSLRTLRNIANALDMYVECKLRPFVEFEVNTFTLDKTDTKAFTVTYGSPNDLISPIQLGYDGSSISSLSEIY